MFIQHISDLQVCWGDINEILRDKKPLYVLIDEAHMMPANNPVWMYLKKSHTFLACMVIENGQQLSLPNQ